MIYKFNWNLPRLLTVPVGSVNVRIASLCSMSSPRESNLARLRKRTGLAFTLCKKALELHNNDLDAAELYLKEEAIKHGYAKAQKLKTRRAVQGLVGLLMDARAKSCALVEVNCETDFVARNENFRQLTAQLTSILLAPSVNGPNPSSVSKSTNTDVVSKRIFSSDDLKFFDDKISQAITQLGENIKLARAIMLKIDDNSSDDLLLFGHSHASGEVISDIDGVSLGKYGSVVIARQLTPEEREKVTKPTEKSSQVSQPERLATSEGSLSEEKEKRQLTDEEIDNQEIDVDFVEEEVNYTVDDVGKILCQQIIGMNPIHLNKPPEVKAKEKELAEKGYKIPEDTEYLNDQKTIVNTRLTISEFCDQHGIRVLDFVRFECGETPEE